MSEREPLQDWLDRVNAWEPLPDRWHEPAWLTTCIERFWITFRPRCRESALRARCVYGRGHNGWHKGYRDNRVITWGRALARPLER